MRTRATPTTSEREFRPEESFFSLTDPKGRISAGNSIFQRISGYTESELIGEPHNVIRHPDMPRAVFRLLWDTIGAGKPIAAYVKNMAKDGSFYWVVALVAPVKDGHVSIRFKPTSPLLASVAPVYARMHEIEEESLARGESQTQAMDAATAHLVEVLGKLGFPSYDAFMQRALLRTEIDSRDSVISKAGISIIPHLPAGAHEHAVGTEADLLAVCGSGRRELSEVVRCYRELSSLLEMEQRLQKGIASANDLSEEFTITALNISIRAMRVGSKGGGVSVVASNLAGIAHQITASVAAMRERAEKVSEAIATAAFNVGWARLQIETAVGYYHEIYNDYLENRAADGSDAFRARVSLSRAVAEAAERTQDATTQALATMGREIHTMERDSDTLRRLVVSLQVSKVVGLTEAAHLSGVLDIHASFEDMKSRIEKIQEVFKVQEDTIDEVVSQARRTPALIGILERSVAHLLRNAERLARSPGARSQAAQEPAPAAEAAAAPKPSPRKAAPVAAAPRPAPAAAAPRPSRPALSIPMPDDAQPAAGELVGAGAGDGGSFKDF